MTSTPERAADGPRVNSAIRARVVQLINEAGTNLGPTDRDEAIRMATEAGLDLVEIAPNSDPPVCKILDFGKYKYQAQKKAAEARKKQKIVEIKEIKMRPNIDDHDYGVKVRSIKRFFEEGDKVKITLRFRGREMAHQELGMELMRRVKSDFEALAKIESEPRFEGRQIVMVMAPR
ncbi:MAG: translation initiation factor IF-3 [Hyphomicrobiaceae bacterium]